jgi:hypothetical protein
MNIIECWRAYPLPTWLRALMICGAIAAIWIGVNGRTAFMFAAGIAFFWAVTS